MSVRPQQARPPAPEPDDDDTIRIARSALPPVSSQRPPELPPQSPPQAKPVAPQPWLTTRRAWLTGAGLLGTACLLRGIHALVQPPAHTPLARAPVAPTSAAPTSAAPTSAANAPIAPAATRSLAGPRFAVQTGTEQEILHHVSTGLTVFRFADDHRIMVLDFASLYQQGRMLNRVAALIEKAGSPRNRVLNDAELAHAISAHGDTVATYYYGHDYSAASLQRFFGAADAAQLALDPEEQTLRALLRQAGWFTPGVQGGLLSVPAVDAATGVTLSARATILHHELSHGLFFSDPDYAGFVHDFWGRALSSDERAGVRGFLGAEGYDTTFEELMYNEMQAYLMFTRDPAFFTPARVGMTPVRLAALQTQFLRGMPIGWLHDALAATPVQLTDAAAPN